MKRRSLVYTAVLSLLASSQLSAADDMPVYGGELTVALGSDIRGTNVGVTRDGNTDGVIHHIVETLVAFKEDLSVGPMLAESYEVSEDKLSYTFKIREGLKFHNGADVTANEVKWSWDRYLDPKTGFRCQEWYDGRGSSGLKIEAIEVLDSYRVRFKLNKPSSVFLNRIAYLQCPTGILHPSSVDEAGNWVKPIATGPYKLKQWERGQFVLLEKFQDYKPRSEPMDGYTGARVAYADSVRFLIIPDPIAAKAAAYAGEIDVVPYIPLGSHNEVKRREAKEQDIKTHFYNVLDWEVLLIEPDHPLLKKPKMRQALAHAVIPAQVAAFSMFNLSKSNSSPVHIFSPFRNELHEQWYEYDPEKAKRLAKEAGYNGEEITLQTNRKFQTHYDNAVGIQAMLHAAGFNVRIEVYDWATQLSNFYKGNFELAAFSYSPRNHPLLMLSTFTGHRKLKRNFQWDHPDIHALLTEAEATFDPAEQQKLFDDAYRLFMKQIPMIGLYNDFRIDVTRSNVDGYKPWPIGKPRLWGVWKSKDGSKRKLDRYQEHN